MHKSEPFHIQSSEPIPFESVVYILNKNDKDNFHLNHKKLLQK